MTTVAVLDLSSLDNRLLVPDLDLSGLFGEIETFGREIPAPPERSMGVSTALRDRGGETGLRYPPVLQGRRPRGIPPTQRSPPEGRRPPARSEGVGAEGLHPGAERRHRSTESEVMPVAVRFLLPMQIPLLPRSNSCTNIKTS